LRVGFKVTSILLSTEENDFRTREKIFLLQLPDYVLDVGYCFCLNQHNPGRRLRWCDLQQQGFPFENSKEGARLQVVAFQASIEDQSTPCGQTEKQELGPSEVGSSREDGTQDIGIQLSQSFPQPKTVADPCPAVGHQSIDMAVGFKVNSILLPADENNFRTRKKLFLFQLSDDVLDVGYRFCLNQNDSRWRLRW
jgi:hypothetical protein